MPFLPGQLVLTLRPAPRNCFYLEVESTDPIVGLLTMTFRLWGADAATALRCGPVQHNFNSAKTYSMGVHQGVDLQAMAGGHRGEVMLCLEIAKPVAPKTSQSQVPSLRALTPKTGTWWTVSAEVLSSEETAAMSEPFQLPQVEGVFSLVLRPACSEGTFKDAAGRCFVEVIGESAAAAVVAIGLGEKGAEAMWWGPTKHDFKVTPVFTMGAEGAVDLTPAVDRGAFTVCLGVFEPLTPGTNFLQVHSPRKSSASTTSTSAESSPRAEAAHRCALWTVDSRRLRSSDQTAVSQALRLNGVPGSFKMILRPAHGGGRHGANSFRKARGRCFVDVKGEGVGHVTMTIGLRRGSTSIQWCGPVEHDFRSAPVFSMGLERARDLLAWGEESVQLWLAVTETLER